MSAAWAGPDDLAPLCVEIETLREDPANARYHPERNLAAVSRSLQLFGQQKPIVVTSDGTIVAGNGTFAAAKRLGWTRIARVVTNLDARDVRGFAIADNRTGELSGWDKDRLVADLATLETMGLSPTDDLAFENINELLGTGKADPEKDDDAPKPTRAFVYRVVVDCEGEDDQREVIARLEREGRKVKALMS